MLKTNFWIGSIPRIVKNAFPQPWIWSCLALELPTNKEGFRLDTLDNANGVDVEFQVGSGVAIENIITIPKGKNRLVFCRIE